MVRLSPVFGHMVLAVAVTAFSISQARAEVLTSIGINDVATTYTYPAGQDSGILTLSDTGLGLLATFADAADLNLVDTQLTLSVPFLGELGDAGDDIAFGEFGAGTITIVDLGPESGVPLFQADIVGLMLAESQFVSGAFAGTGTFTNATYGGALAGVTLPTSGSIITDLFTWRTGSLAGPSVDIDNFVDAPIGGETIYSDMHDLSIVPEPTTLAMLAVIVFSVRRRR